LSAARNKGIDVAQGKYIWFVDSDDFIEPNVLSLLLKKIIKDDLDMLRFNYQNVNEEYRVVPQKKKAKKFVNYTDAIVDGTTFLAHRLGYACYACQFLIKTNILKREENKFKVGIYFEDVEWLPRLLITLKRLLLLILCYNYLYRTGSITKTMISVIKKI
jgi:glycosyltransferase involved in cell wall biosynthesis